MAGLFLSLIGTSTFVPVSCRSAFNPPPANYSTNVLFRNGDKTIDYTGDPVKLSNLGGAKHAEKTISELLTDAPRHAPRHDGSIIYLRKLYKTYVTALGGLLLAVVIGGAAFADIYLYMRTGASILHPAFDLFVLLGVLVVIVVSFVSMVSTREYLRSVITRMGE